jgi:hypothetical protein
VPNEKTQPIQWTKWLTGALVAASSLWPSTPPCASRYFGKACGFMLYLLPKPLILALGELAPTLTMIKTL